MKKLIKKSVAVLLAAVTAAGMLAACAKDDTKTGANEEPTTVEEPTTEADTRPLYVGSNVYPGDWCAITFEDGSDYIPIEDLEKYADTGVTCQVDFMLEDSDYYVIAIAEAKNWNNKLYQVDTKYISDIVPKTEAYDENNVPLYYASIQDDGFVSLPLKDCETNGISYSCTSFTFTITSEGIKYLIDNPAVEEGEVQGIKFQTHGVNVTRLYLEADVIDAKMQ
ncbi:MAG: hypothetical protein ACI4EW_03885 [Butyrivibrio sp.]